MKSGVCLTQNLSIHLPRIWTQSKAAYAEAVPGIRLPGYPATRLPGYPTETVIIRFHFLLPITRKQLFKILTEHLSHTNGSLEKTRIKASEVTFADSLSQTWWLLFDISSLFWVDCRDHASIMSWYVCLLFAVIGLVGHMNYFFDVCGESFSIKRQEIIPVSPHFVLL